MDQALKEIDLFNGLDESQIQALLQQGQERRVATGDVLLHEGDEAQGLFVLVEGQLEVRKSIAGRATLLGYIQPGSFVGEISLLTNMPHSATVQATADSRIVHFPKQLFDESLNTSPLIRAILRTMSQRLRATEATVQQHEKLSSLGKLAAGLAHELNNPAAASLRAVQQLPQSLLTLQSLVFQLNELGLSAEDVAFLTSLQDDLVARAANPARLDPLTRSDQEEALASWIEAQGIDEGWRLAPALVTAGVDEAQLSALRQRLGAERLAHALTWLEGMLTVRALLNTVEASTVHICELVSAVKEYSYMDRSPVQDVDLHDGLESTLTIMGYKLRGVAVERNYAPDLPHITAHGSRLNQVWTNLIDNAVDAMNGEGLLRLRTWRDEDRVVVEIGDNGPGIPEDIRHRIYEPFFTTKDVSRGVGLGLDTVYHIVTQEHHGEIRLSSQPGDTRFQILLPTSS